MTGPRRLGIRIPALEPGSPEWLAKISASKVPAILGLSPWQSRFSLWFDMAGKTARPPQTTAQARGHYLEDAIATWFADQHPEYGMTGGGSWQHHTHEWATANPDRLLYNTNEIARPAALLELKSEGNTDTGWGKPGTDEIPPGYRAQVQWQLFVTGVDVCHIAVLGPFLEFAEYTVHHDQDETAWIHGECQQFLDDLRNNVRPNIDGHTETYATVRRLHPEIDRSQDVAIPRDLAEAFCTSRANLAAAKTQAQLQASLLADYLGAARRATYDGQTIADRRRGRGDNPPFLCAAKNLPTDFPALDEETAA